MAVNPIILQRCEQSGIRELADFVRKAIADGKNVMSYPELNELISKHIWQLSADANKAIADVADKRHDIRLRMLPNQELKNNWMNLIVAKAENKVFEVEKWKKIQRVAAETFADFAEAGKKFQTAS